MFCPSRISATVYFQYLFFASQIFSTQLVQLSFCLLKNKCTVTSNSLSQDTFKKKKLTVYMNDLRFLLLKTVPGILVAKTAALNERRSATQCSFWKKVTNCTRKYKRPHDCHMNEWMNEWIPLHNINPVSLCYYLPVALFSQFTHLYVEYSARMSVTNIYFKTVSNALKACAPHTVSEWILLFALNTTPFRRPVCRDFP